MFYDLFAHLEALHYQHFLWMEPDVLPVQQGWLERMTDEVRGQRAVPEVVAEGQQPALRQLVRRDPRPTGLPPQRQRALLPGQRALR